MRLRLAQFLFLTISQTAFAADQISSSFRPKDGANGYVGKLSFDYKMQDCFNDLHIGIKQHPPAYATEYIYKGKSYKPVDLGLTSFAPIKNIYVENLTADILDRQQRVGSVAMTNVIEQAGYGCYGQSYSVKKSIPSLDGKAASKRLNDFTLSNASMIGTTTDANIETLIKKNESETKKVQAASAAAMTAGQKVASPQSTESAKASEVVKQSAVGKPTTSGQPQQQIDVNKYQSDVQANIKKIDQSSKVIGEKSVQAAGYLGDAASGAWNSGAGLGAGIMVQDEDSGFFLSVMMADWKNSWSGKNPPSEFMAGGFVYMAIGLENYKPVEGVAIRKGANEVTQAQMGLDFLNNSFGWDTIRLVAGPTMYLVNTYGPMGKPEEQYKLKFGADVGLALAGNGALMTATYNLSSEVYGFHLVFHK